MKCNTITPATYYGYAITMYMYTRLARNMTDTDVDALDCGGLAGFEHELDMSDNAYHVMMHGRPSTTSNTFDNDLPF